MNYTHRILQVLNKPIKDGLPKYTYKKHRKVICGYEIGINVPSGLSYTEAEKYLPALVATCGREIELDDYKGLLVVRIIEKDYDKEMKFKKSELLPDKLFIGYDRLLKPVYHPLNVHMLIAGAARSGKTDALRWFIYQFLLQNYDVYICDMKEISFYPFEGLVTKIGKSLAQCCEILEGAVKELDNRKKTIDYARNRDLKDDFQPRVIVIDEAAALAPSQYKQEKDKNLAWRCDNAIGLLGMQAREFKIFVLYATQRPDMSIINKLFKATVEAKIAFRTSTGTNSQIIIDKPGAENISPATPGRCIYAYDRDYLLQVPYIGSDSSWSKLLLPLKTEVLNNGTSKRTNEKRNVIDGTFSTPDSEHSATKPPIQQWVALEASKRATQSTREGETGTVRMASTFKNMESNQKRKVINEEYSDEL